MQLQERIFRVVVPTEDVIEIKNGQRRTVTRKIYPGYVLVDMVLDEVTWHAVRNAPGVTGFVGGMGTEPVPVPESELRYILRTPAAGAESQAQDPRSSTRLASPSRSSVGRSASSSARSARSIKSATR